MRIRQALKALNRNEISIKKEHEHKKVKEVLFHLTRQNAVLIRLETGHGILVPNVSLRQLLASGLDYELENFYYIDQSGASIASQNFLKQAAFASRYSTQPEYITGTFTINQDEVERILRTIKTV